MLSYDLSFFLIRNAAVPPINVPIIVNGSGTAVETGSGANASPRALIPVTKFVTVPIDEMFTIEFVPPAIPNRLPLSSKN